MVTIALPLTGSKIIADVGRPFDCARSTSSQLRPIRMGTFNMMPCVKKVPRSVHVNNHCNNSVRGPYVACGKAKFRFLSNIPSFSSGSPNFFDLYSERPLLQDRLEFFLDVTKTFIVTSLTINYLVFLVICSLKFKKRVNVYLKIKVLSKKNRTSEALVVPPT